MRLPRKLPAGSSPFADEWNAMVDALRANKIHNGSGLQFRVTPFGTVPSATQQRSASEAAGGGGGAVTKMKITSVAGIGSNYVTCDQYDASSSVVASSVQVAIPYALRTAPAAYLTVWPAYTVGDYIMAAQPVGGTGTTTTGSQSWIDLNIGARKWALQLTICVAGVSRTVYVPAQP